MYLGPIQNGDIPASYVSLPEGNQTGNWIPDDSWFLATTWVPSSLLEVEKMGKRLPRPITRRVHISYNTYIYVHTTSLLIWVDIYILYVLYIHIMFILYVYIYIWNTYTFWKSITFNFYGITYEMLQVFLIWWFQAMNLLVPGTSWKRRAEGRWLQHLFRGCRCVGSWGQCWVTVVLGTRMSVEVSN